MLELPDCSPPHIACNKKNPKRYMSLLTHTTQGHTYYGQAYGEIL